jgi:hypothetical protein
LVVVAWLVPFAFYTADYFLDDAFIGFRYLENVLAGEGFVGNTGTRVEGVTSIGWLMALLSLASILGPPQAAKILGLATVILTLVLAVRVAIAYRPGARTQSELLPVAPALLVVSSVDFLYFPLSGMESGLAAALTLLGTWVFLPRPRLLMTVAVVAWVQSLVRPEFGLAYPLSVGALLAMRTGHWGLVAVPSAVWTVLVSVSGLARYLYFGVLLPNTFLGKSAILSELPDNFLASLSSDHINLPPFLAAPRAGHRFCRIDRGEQLAVRSVRQRRLDRVRPPFRAGAAARGSFFGWSLGNRHSLRWGALGAA